MRMDNTEAIKAERRILANWLLGAAAVGLVVAILLPMIRSGDVGLRVYLLAAERLLEGQAIYRSGGESFTYPPFFALFFVPFEAIPEALNRPVWYFLSVVMLGASLGLVHRSVAPMWRVSPINASGRDWVFGVGLVVLSARHLMAPIENEAHDLVVLLLLALMLDADRRGKEAATGAYAGLAVACKVTPLVFLPILLWQRRFVAAVAMVAVGAAATLLPDLVTPSADGQLWVASWYRTFLTNISPGIAAEAEGAWASWNHLNQSLAGSLHRLLTPLANPAEYQTDVSLWTPGADGRAAIIMAAQLAVVAAVAAAAGRPGAGRPGVRPIGFRQGTIAAALCAMVLLSPMSSKAHFGVLVVPIAYGLAGLAYRRWDWPTATALFIVFVAGTLTAKDIVGRPLGDWLLAMGSVTLVALAALFAAIRTQRTTDWEHAASSDP